MKKRSKRTWVDFSTRIEVDNYGEYFNACMERVFDTLKTPYNCPREEALLEVKRCKQEYVDELYSTHKTRIPTAVAYMKLRGFIHRIRHKLGSLSQPTFGDLIVKHKYIGFSGEMGVGKTLSATMLQQELDMCNINSIMCSFAEPVKTIMIDHFGFTWQDVYTPEGKRSFNDFWGMTNRECLQKFATEAIRNGFHHNAWVKLAELKAKKYSCLCLFDDVRFENEYAFIKTKGVVIRIYNPNVEINSKHESEIISDDYDDIIVNDGTKQDLRKKVLAMAKKYEVLPTNSICESFGSST